VSDSAEDSLDLPATSSARWKESRVVVDAYSALYVKMVMRRRELRRVNEG
jgi:hypothetical protein